MPLKRKVKIDKGKIAYIVKIDPSGRICIPKEIRDALKCKEFALEVTKEGKIVLEPINS